jgi:hypothetical protein
MYAISIEQSQAAEILSGSLPSLFRFWRTDHRGPLLIHARKATTAKGDFASAPNGERNAFVGVVELVDCITSWPPSADSDELEYHRVLANHRILVQPLPGRQANEMSLS